jgi:hypothetical protein
MPFHKKLVGNINSSNQQVTEAHAALARAILANDKANSAMATWIEHVTEKYDLLPNDSITQDGAFLFQDEGWKQRIADMQAAAAEVPLIDPLAPPRENDFQDQPGEVLEISDEHPEGVVVPEVEAPADVEYPVEAEAPREHPPEDGGPVRVLPAEPPVRVHRANGSRRSPI